MHHTWRCSGTGGAGVAARFEIHLGGLELANGYDELIDAAERGERFADDNRQRQALEVDRLLQLALGKDSVAEVMAFALPRC